MCIVSSPKNIWEVFIVLSLPNYNIWKRIQFCPDFAYTFRLHLRVYKSEKLIC